MIYEWHLFCEVWNGIGWLFVNICATLLGGDCQCLSFSGNSTLNLNVTPLHAFVMRYWIGYLHNVFSTRSSALRISGLVQQSIACPQFLQSIWNGAPLLVSSSASFEKCSKAHAKCTATYGSRYVQETSWSFGLRAAQENEVIDRWHHEACMAIHVPWWKVHCRHFRFRFLNTTWLH